MAMIEETISEGRMEITVLGHEASLLSCKLPAGGGLDILDEGSLG